MSDGTTASTSGDPEIPAGTIVVAESGTGHLQQLLFDGRHRLLADEPVAYGGGDTGPNPYDLLLMSLGACTSMTLRLYAERKRWPLERVTVRLRHRRIHAEDCANCETKQGMVDRIDREIALHGPLDPDMRARLLQIADQCPVHRTLKSEIIIDTILTAG